MLPRSLVVLALLLVANASDETTLPKTRKSLKFGYQKPHSKFVVVNHAPHTVSAFAPAASEDPFEVATDFVHNLASGLDEGAEGYTYHLRRDSYTDKTTGVSHAFFKQRYMGLEVDGGVLNVNVYKGSVISYGDETHRESLHKRSESQLPLVVPDAEHSDRVVTHPVEAPEPKHSDDFASPEAVVLELTKFVTPSAELAQSIAMDPAIHLEKIVPYTKHDLHSSVDDHLALFLKGVPSAVTDVKVRMVYAQTPKGLQPAWKIDLELEDNYYQATVSPYSSSMLQIFDLIDWVSDSPEPLYMPNKADFLHMPPIIPYTKDKDKKKKPKEPEAPEVPSEVDAQYLVFPWGVNDPAEGNRSLLFHSKIVDPVASPYGWHSIPLSHVPAGLENLLPAPGVRNPVAPPTPPTPAPEPLVNFTVTVGNNVLVQENFQGRNDYLNNYRPDAGASRNFSFAYAPVSRNDTAGRMEEAKKHINATITQLFVTSNEFHDLMYRYGFDELSGNFQQYNFGKGGKEDDAVIANAQDGSGFNNANFMTPPDGTPGRMRMYLWNTASPYRDGDFEAGIVIHELAHGLSTRLTGGPDDPSCLAFGESGGMGEGWGDFLATTIRSTKNYSDFPMGSWAANTVKGIRNYPYSLNKTINPETYKSVDKYFGVHPIGEVWAEMLWVVLQRLIKKHGFTDSLFPPTPLEDGTMPPDSDFYRPAIQADGPLIPKHGNSLMVQLVVSGMKLQKCRPDFMDARNAIIQADQLLTRGENYCDIWAGFADRGLGEDAKVVGKLPWGGGIRTDGFSVPLACAGKI